MKVYKISGEFIVKKILREPHAKEGVNTVRKVKYKFSKEVLAENDKDAIEYIYKLFGGIYKIKRKSIKINNVEEIKDIENIKDKAIKRYLINNKNE